MTSVKGKTRGSAFYSAWVNMKARCKPDFRQAKDYHERGIKIEDPRWYLFENFDIDMAGSYQPGLTLDRIDNDKGYSKENCRWTSKAEQQRNRRIGKGMTYEKAEIIRRMYKDGGVTQPQLAKRFGVTSYTIQDIIRGHSYANP